MVFLKEELIKKIFLFIVVFVLVFTAKTLVIKDNDSKIISSYEHKKIYDFLIEDEKQDKLRLMGGPVDIPVDNGTFISGYKSFMHRIYSEKTSFNFEPLFIETIVIALRNEEKTKNIKGFKDLLSSDLKIFFKKKQGRLLSPIFSNTVYAIASEYSDKFKASLEEFFDKILKKNQVVYDLKEADVVIVPDWKAAEMILSGEKMKIIIPENTKNSFVYGLLYSGEKLNVDIERLKKNLYDSGYRVSEDYYDETLLPAKSEYKNVKALSDFEDYNKKIDSIYPEIKNFIPKRHSELPYRLSDSFLQCWLLMLLSYYHIIRYSKKIIRPELKRAVIILFSLVIFMCFIRIFKKTSPYDSFIERFFWYFGYSLMSLYPVVMIYIAYSVNLIKKESEIPRFRIFLLFIFSLFLSVLVLFNDYHQLAFNFKNGFTDYYANHSLGILYFVIVSWCIFMEIISLLIIIRNNKSSLRQKRNLYPIFAIIITIVYNFLYTIKFNPIYSLDRTLMQGIMITIFIDFLFFAKLIPANTNYRECFEASSLNMEIYDKHSNKAVFFGRRNTVLDNTMYKENTKKITGGYLKYREDISEIASKKEKAFELLKQLEAAKNLLKTEKETSQKLISLKLQNQILEKIEKSASQKIKELSKLIGDLSKDPNSKEIIARINLIACYIKRRSLMLVNSFEEKDSSERLLMRINELSQNLNELNISCSSIFEIKEELDFGVSITLYDLYFAIFDYALKCRDKSLVLSAKISEEKPIISLVTNIKVDLDDLKKTIRKIGLLLHIEYSKNDWEGNDKLVFKLV